VVVEEAEELVGDSVAEAEVDGEAILLLPQVLEVSQLECQVVNLLECQVVRLHYQDRKPKP